MFSTCDLICHSTGTISEQQQGFHGFPRFDSMRGCCRMARRTWPRISMCVKGRGAGGGSRLAPAILGDASCQSSIRHFGHLNHSSCQIQNDSCFTTSCSNSLIFMGLPPLCQECLWFTFSFYKQKSAVPPVQALTFNILLCTRPSFTISAVINCSSNS